MLPPSMTAAPLILLFLLPAYSAAQPSAYPDRPPPTSTTPLHHIPRALEPRQQLCTEKGSQLCANIPNSKFCCPTGTECISLDSGSSVICCKIGEQCDQIRPVGCPIAGASISNDNSITAKNLQCGDLCCPIGFQCSADGKTCNMKPGNVPSHYKTKPVDSAPSPPTVTTPGVASPAGSSTSKDSDPAAAVAAAGENIKGACNANEFPVKAVLVGFFPGMVLGALLLYLSSLLRDHIAAHRSRRRRSIKSFCQPSPPITISRPMLHQPMENTSNHSRDNSNVSRGTSREDAAKVLAWSSSSPMTPFGPFSARSRGALSGVSTTTSLGNFISNEEKPRLAGSAAPWSPDGSRPAIPARLRTVTSATTTSSAHQQHPGATVLPQTATVTNLTGVSHGGWGLGRELVPGAGPGGRGTVTTLGSLASSDASMSPPMAPGLVEGMRPLSSTPPLPPLKVGKLFDRPPVGSLRSPVGGGMTLRSPGGMRTPGGYV